MIYANILELIGNTPMVKINKISPNQKVNIFAKLEGFNPGGSIKDRIALKMIEQAEKEGRLNSSKTIIEPTSGNTGIALAMIGAVKGYQVEIVMSEAVSIERRKMIEAFGGKIILTDPTKGTDGAIMKAREMVKNNPEKYFMPDQFSNEYNKLAHYEYTAQEIWEQTEGKIDYFVSAIGTSGTLMGVGTYLKSKNPKIKIISAEPVRGHYIQGLKNMEEAIVPALYNKDLLDEIIMVDTEETFDMARRVTREEGISVGMSSGAAMLAAVKLAEKIERGSIVTIFPDRGEKYLSTKLFA
ncbi:MAG: cysteine synthase A [Patescibacteria group bacterium]|nr:cysteine synthase A [Patescibacteria group bacterium]MDD4611283.1 cysteine synthase A [Patescibacteria group bacterium]